MPEQRERDLWSIKFTLSLDLKQGNTNKLDYTARANIKRRVFDYPVYSGLYRKYDKNRSR